MGARGLLVAVGGVVVVTLVALMIALLNDVNNLSGQVSALEGITASAQGSSATIAIQSIQNELPHYKITCTTAGPGDLESCVISPPS
jgi:hypothetical protein